MANRFENKTAVITGAATGIGFEIARGLLAEGASVIINDRDEDAAALCSRELAKKYPGRFHLEVGDASSITLIKKLIDQAVHHFGSVDIAIANAGITTFGDFFEFSPQQFQAVMNLNLQGTFFLTQAAARQMRLQGKGGRILLTSSVIGIQAYPQLTAYAMTKAAISMMAKNLVLELSPHRININAIAPGATVTPRTMEEESDYTGQWSRLIPLGKAALPQDIALPALFLLSDQANHMTGQTVVVDGGWTAFSPSPSTNGE